ncbi:hypothetical protein ABFX02_02G028600 [Erythranthe guttata]
MPSVLRSNLPKNDDFSAQYSFAVEYSGPPLNRDIPQVFPVDLRRIPTATVASGSSLPANNLCLRVVQPIAQTSDHTSKKVPSTDLTPEIADRNGAQSSTSSGTLGFSDGLNESNHLSESSDVSYAHCPNPTASNSNQDLPLTDDDDLVSEDSDHDGVPTAIFPEKPVLSDELKKGLCHRCRKKNRFSEKEICIVCGAKYCSKCVLRAMGCMQEGRKCITCVGYRIDESKRELIGKPSRMLRKLLTDDAIKQIMCSEMTCEVNQLPPQLIYVNDRALSMEELVMLQSCPNPPKKIRPGKYWYDKMSGFWGKDGEKPSQIISALLPVGYQIRQDASNGNTNVLINSREITTEELWMLRAAGIHCEGNTHFWVTPDGSYQHEGMNYVMGKLWDKKRVRLLCAALSLPYPSDTANLSNEDVEKNNDKVNSKNVEQSTMNKLLLIGCDQSGTSTIFKQAKILYNVPFSEDEKQSIKIVIQRNLYRYIGILLEGREIFEEDRLIEMQKQNSDEPGPSGNSCQVDEKTVLSLSPKLEAFSSWLIQIMASGNLDAIFPAATREYSHLVEELWKDRAFQAIYKRRNELHMLPRVANYFLDHAVEISRIDYEPSEMDILYAEGITSSNGIASMEFSFPKSSQDEYMESSDQNNPSLRYQLIRVHASGLGENCKWLEMFEDVDLVLYCVSLTEYDEYYEDINGTRTNKMLAARTLFECIATHPSLHEKDFLLILNKFDLLEEKIEQSPLTQCEWFHDFNPVFSLHPHSSKSNNNPPLAERAFHYIALKFKSVFSSLTGRKLFVSRATGLEADSIDKALRYGKEIVKWADEKHTVDMNEWSSDSTEPSTSP